MQVESALKGGLELATGDLLEYENTYAISAGGLAPLTISGFCSEFLEP